jgi:hypothetical protein
MWDVELRILELHHLGFKSYMWKHGVKVIPNGHIHQQFAVLSPCQQIEWLTPSSCSKV